MKQPRILVVYHNQQPTLRATNAEALRAWKAYAPATVAYHNTYLGAPPRDLLDAAFDIIVFHQLFLSEKWTAEAWGRARAAVAPLMDNPASKAVFVQDEFLHSRFVADFIEDAGVATLFTLADAAGARSLYGDLVDRIHVERVLPGYLDDSAASLPRRPIADRSVDLGYRTWDAPAWTGRFGRLKTDIARRAVASPRAGALRLDISTRPEDAILGTGWFDFLSSCRAVLGTEGGASLHDPDGAIRDRIDAFLRGRPDASFEDIAAACFPGLDTLNYAAVSPRHLEAAATGSAQVLLAGDYSGVLEAERHYIRVARDFSDLDAALDRLHDVPALQAMADRTHDEIIRSGRYTWRSFLTHLVPRLADAAGGPGPVGDPDAVAALISRHEGLQDQQLTRRFQFDYPDRPPADAKEASARRDAEAAALQADAQAEAALGAPLREPSVLEGPQASRAIAHRVRLRRQCPPAALAARWQPILADDALVSAQVALSDAIDYAAINYDFLEAWFQKVPSAVLVMTSWMGGGLPEAREADWAAWVARGSIRILGPLPDRELYQAVAMVDFVLQLLVEQPGEAGKAGRFSERAGVPYLSADVGLQPATLAALCEIPPRQG